MGPLTRILHTRGVLGAHTSVDLGSPDDRQLVALVRDGIVPEAQFASAVAENHGLKFVELVDYALNRAATAIVPAAVCRRHQIVPLSVSDGTLLVAMADPANVLALDDVRTNWSGPIDVVVAASGELLATIDRFYRADTELDSLSSGFESEPQGDLEGANEGSQNDAPIVRFVNLVIGQAIKDRASDIHLEPSENDLGVRYRIDGVLHTMQAAPKGLQNGVISRVKIMSNIDIAERRKPQDGRMTFTHDGRAIDLRVATMPTVWGEKIVLRILDNAHSVIRLSDLELLERNEVVYRDAFSKAHGMILVTGPTGSGKSTTLYATLDSVARPQINVMTVEDPVEYRIDGINQVQVNSKAGLTFASALRSILRADPDVILVGEIRDRETAQIAIEASLTGHLVLTTLHTNDAPSAVTRLVEMGVEPYLVASAVDCVVAQRLARRLCDRCKTAYAPDADALAAIGFSFPGAPHDLYQSVGCTACSNTGYRGRVALHEVMEVTEEIARLAVASAPSTEIARTAAEQGLVPLRLDGWAKVQLGLTAVDEVLRVATR